MRSPPSAELLRERQDAAVDGHVEARPGGRGLRPALTLFLRPRLSIAVGQGVLTVEVALCPATA